MELRTVSREGVSEQLPQLCELLRDSVASGASVGFLHPMPAGEAELFWSEMAADVQKGTRIICVAETDGHIAGCVHLALVTKPNGRHRAEVQKLLVHTRHRRQGIGRALMNKVEAIARAHGRTLLVLDTIRGDSAEKLYRSLGWTEAGGIPGFAMSSKGGLEETVIFFKEID